MSRPGPRPFDASATVAISGIPTSASVRMGSERCAIPSSFLQPRCDLGARSPSNSPGVGGSRPSSTSGLPSDAHRSSVTLTQRGTMRNSPTGRAMRFRAVQTINLRQPEFAWRATAGPFGCISVIDALANSEANWKCGHSVYCGLRA